LKGLVAALKDDKEQLARTVDDLRSRFESATKVRAREPFLSDHHERVLQRGS